MKKTSPSTRLNSTGFSSLAKLRHLLHENAELSGSESKTAAIITKFCVPSSPAKVIRELGGHGLAVIYKASNPGPTVMIRCELDALPIREDIDLPYRSREEGVSHKCGHDGHMVMVAGLTTLFDDDFPKTGTLVLLFQPAEETGKGAYEVLNDPKFTEIRPDFIFALHNIPGLPLHQIIVPDQFSATVQSAKIAFTGLKAHAANPDQGISPAPTLAAMTEYCRQLSTPETTADDFKLVVPVYINCGTMDYGISPGEGEFHFTCRTWKEAEMDELKVEIATFAKKIAEVHRLHFEIEWFDYFPASTNDESCRKIVRQVANQLQLDCLIPATPFRFGEDFGWFSQRFPSCIFGLGSGVRTPGLHNPAYDFPDELIPTGLAMFEGIIREFLGGKLEECDILKSF